MENTTPAPPSSSGAPANSAASASSASGPWAIGVDVGGTAIKAALIDPAGHTHHQLAVPTPTAPKQLVDTANQAVATLLDQAHTHDQKVLETIGVNIPGIVDEQAGRSVFAANLGWNDVPVRELMEQATGRPVIVGHDVRAGALAESQWGSGHDDFFFMAIGTGISSVIVVDGASMSSAPWAGEIGQIPVPGYDGELTPLERVSAAGGIARRGVTQGLVPEGSGSAEVFALADASCAPARNIITYALDTLARAIAPIIAALGPVPIVVSGGLIKRGTALTDALARAIKDNLGIVPPPVAVEPALLGADAQVRGAALRAFREAGTVLATPR